MSDLKQYEGNWVPMQGGRPRRVQFVVFEEGTSPPELWLWAPNEESMSTITPEELSRDFTRVKPSQGGST